MTVLAVLLLWLALSGAVVLGLAALFSGTKVWESRARSRADESRTADVRHLPLAG